MSNNYGNSVVIYNYKFVKLMNKINSINFKKHLDLYGNYVEKFNSITSRLGLEIDFTDIKAVRLAVKHSKQILQNILDNIPNDLTQEECKELLITDRDFDLPSVKYKDEKAIGNLGLTYNLQEAHAIISNVRGNQNFNKICNAFDYLDLVDGDYLGTNDNDAVYFNSNHKLASVNDIYKEYNNAIKYLEYHYDKSLTSVSS